MTATVDNAVADALRANAELTRQLDEALARERAMAEVLAVINSPPGDLMPVFQTIVEKAHALCDAAYGSLQLWDGERFRGVAMRGFPEAMMTALRAGYSPATMPCQHLIEGESIAHCVDLAEIDSPIAREGGVKLAGIRTILYVALRKDGVLLGQIVAARKEVRPFTDKEIALVESFAAQAVIAMENARLITETREALEQQTATTEVLQVINSSPGDLAPVFDAMLEKSLRLCDAVYGSLLSYDGELFRNAAIVHADRQVGVGFLRRPPFPAPPGSILDRVVRGADIVYTEDILQDVDYRHEEPEFRELVAAGDYRSLLDVALRKDGALLGVIGIFRAEARPFTDKQIALLQNFAAQAVIAMENARLLGELRERTEEIAGWNKELEARVAAQLAEIERSGKLRRFLAPQLAELIVAQGDDSILESHRCEIVVVFCDLRGFTGFAERAEPEEVMALLRDYHAAMGPIVAQYEGTIDHYSGDGIMVFFNDPLPTPDPAKRAIDMAVAMRGAAQGVLRNWRRHGHDLGFGVGISQGYATLGQIGFAERMDYTAIGTVTNLAARLCAEAKDGQILVSARVATAIEDSARLEEIGDLSLKGLSQAVAIYNVVAVGAEGSAS